jgi:hypothetical protein
MVFAHERGLDQDSPRPLYWGAIIAGAIAALVIQFMLNLLGAGVGAAALDPAATQAQTATGIAFAWWSVAGVLSALAGGALAGRLAKQAGMPNAMSHGLAAWAVSALAVVGSFAGVLGGGVGSVAGPLGAQVAAYGELSAVAIDMTAAPEETQALQAQAQRAANAVASGALISFAALLLGAAAAALGACWAAGMARIGQPMGTRRAEPAPPRYDETQRPH